MTTSTCDALHTNWITYDTQANRADRLGAPNSPHCHRCVHFTMLRGLFTEPPATVPIGGAVRGGGGWDSARGTKRQRDEEGESAVQRRARQEDQLMGRDTALNDKFAECIVVSTQVPDNKLKRLCGRWYKVGMIGGSPVFNQD